MNSTDLMPWLRLAIPEVIVVVTALAVLAADLLFFRRSTKRVRFSVAAAIAFVGCAAAIYRLVFASEQANLLNGVFLSNPLTRLVQIALLVLSVVTLFLSIDSDFTEHVGEFALLILIATTGMMFLVASQDLLVIFISCLLYTSDAADDLLCVD